MSTASDSRSAPIASGSAVTALFTDVETVPKVAIVMLSRRLIAVQSTAQQFGSGPVAFAVVGCDRRPAHGVRSERIPVGCSGCRKLPRRQEVSCG